MSFGDDLDRFARKAEGNINAFTKEVVGELALSLILKSPVGDPALWKHKPPPGYVGGQFRANWRLGIDNIDGTTTEEIDADGGATLDRIVGSIPEEAGGRIYFLTNSLEYAFRLENGWSSQAPNGMVTLTVIEYEQLARKAALKVNSINGAGFGQ